MAFVICVFKPSDNGLRRADELRQLLLSEFRFGANIIDQLGDFSVDASLCNQAMHFCAVSHHPGQDFNGITGLSLDNNMANAALCATGRGRLDRLNQFDLLGIKETGMRLFIIEDQRLPVRTDGDVIGVGNDEGSLAVQHNPNRTERLGMHQIFDVIGDHWDGS